MTALQAKRPQKPPNADIHEFCQYRQILQCVKEILHTNVMLCLSKILDVSITFVCVGTFLSSVS